MKLRRIRKYRIKETKVSHFRKKKRHDGGKNEVRINSNPVRTTENSSLPLHDRAARFITHNEAMPHIDAKTAWIRFTPADYKLRYRRPPPSFLPSLPFRLVVVPFASVGK